LKPINLSPHDPQVDWSRSWWARMNS